MSINKFTTLLDLTRQSKILTGETASFDGKIEVGLPFSAYTTGVDTGSTVSLGIVSSETAVFSGNNTTTIFDVSNPTSPNYSSLYSGFTAFTWTNPLFSATTSGLTLPITVLDTTTQVLGPYWTLTQTGMTGDYNIDLEYSGFSLSYSFNNVVDISTTALTSYSGFTTVTQENFSARTLDYKGPLDYISSKEDITVDGRLTTNKIKITNGASSGSTGYVLTQTNDDGEANWQPGGTFSGNTSGSCISNLHVTNLHGCSRITIHDNLQHTGSTASGLLSVSFGSNTTASGNYSTSKGSGTTANGTSSYAGGTNSVANGTNSFAHFNSNGTLGAYSNYSAILGGEDHNIQETCTSSGIFCGSGNTLGTDILRSVVIGGTGINATISDTVFVPDLVINGLLGVTDLQTNGEGLLIDGASDIKYKKNILKIDSSLEKILKLNPVSFEWKKDIKLRKGRVYGLIAQEVNLIIPNVVRNRAKGNGSLTIEYKELIPLIISAIKELVSKLNVTKEDTNRNKSTSSDDRVLDRNTRVDVKNITNNVIITEYTPTSSDDTFGKMGMMTRDDNYIYIKGVNGWKRSSLEKF